MQDHVQRRRRVGIALVYPATFTGMRIFQHSFHEIEQLLILDITTMCVQHVPKPDTVKRFPQQSVSLHGWEACSARILTT